MAGTFRRFLYLVGTDSIDPTADPTAPAFRTGIEARRAAQSGRTGVLYDRSAKPYLRLSYTYASPTETKQGMQVLRKIIIGQMKAEKNNPSSRGDA